MELYEFFNKIALQNGYETISFNFYNYLENTYFYKELAINKIKLFLENQSKEKEVWIWGAGEAGQAVLHYLNRSKYTVNGYIDSDPRKHNSLVMEKIIKNPESFIFTRNTKIIISSFHAFKEISSFLETVDLKCEEDYIFPYKSE
jgi:FlaA1/EpsC-like NDP-sugar epimerase